MKLIMAIINNDDASSVSGLLAENGFSVTKMATTGGFLMSGNTTFLIGTSDNKVQRAIELIGKGSRKRKQVVDTSVTAAPHSTMSASVEINVGGATIFVLSVERFEKV
ncbi:MAG: cyclic-di-AMP receptor [Clostridia bacterium]|nr:cyclic-di-AMP receptor [Clostridia bacterium]